MTITPIPVKEDLFSGPLPVPANQLNEIARNSTKVGAVLENHSISYDKKTQELQGIATKTIMNSSNIGTDEDVPLKPTVGFVQIVTLAPDVIVTKISVNNKPRYVSFIKINGQWTANAYNADIMNNQN